MPITKEVVMTGVGTGKQSRKFVLTDRLIDFAVIVIQIVEALPDNRLGSHVGAQLLRSGSSPAPNYAEALSAESRRDFIHKLGIALKELREAHVWLQIIKRKNLISRTELLERSLAECNELISILVTSIKTAKLNLERERHFE